MRRSPRRSVTVTTSMGMPYTRSRLSGVMTSCGVPKAATRPSRIISTRLPMEAGSSGAWVLITTQ